MRTFSTKFCLHVKAAESEGSEIEDETVSAARLPP